MNQNSGKHSFKKSSLPFGTWAAVSVPPVVASSRGSASWHKRQLASGDTFMPERDYRGLLIIGDPHLEGRQPGFRKDDYPNVILDKLAWCLNYANNNRLLPAILGDLFDKPRDNPTWMLG